MIFGDDFRRQEAWAEEVVPFKKTKHILRSRKPP